MFNLSENYHLRKLFLQKDQVPTQSMMKKKMTPKLAAVYFTSMTPKLKVIAGLEPSLKGGGNDWYIPPQEILDGRVVLKPVKKQVLANLTHHGIDKFGTEVFQKHRDMLKIEKEHVLFDCDFNWRKDVELNCRQAWEDAAELATKKNTEYMHNAFDYFTYLYRMSLEKFETLLHESAIAEIERTRERALQKMKTHYAAALKSQASQLYNSYTQKLENEKARLKSEFIQKLEQYRTEMSNKMHDLHVDKHVAVEKAKRFLECQNLACQIYVALKERETCQREIELSKHYHKKKAKALANQIAFKDLEIMVAVQKDIKRQEFDRMWQKKMCHVIKKFQLFVSYCLITLPDHAEFFVNMEKLMMLQLSQALEVPTAESIIVTEEEQFQTPIPRPHPFYLFCDRGYKPVVDQDLCPKRCTSSASQLPVIIVNKRCIYAACDNFEQFTNKIKYYIHGKRGDDADFQDDNIYEYYVPVQYSSSKQMLELKLESSLMQVLHQEIHNAVEDSCHIPACFCTPCDTLSFAVGNKTRHPSLVTVSSEVSAKKIFVSHTKRIELEHEREPKWERFFEHVAPKRCVCDKTAKKHLAAHLPAYMRHRSKYESPDLQKYEMCSVQTLKKMVKEARGIRTPPVKPYITCRTKDVSTQYEDLEYEQLCTCFSDRDITELLCDLSIDPSMLISSNSDGKFKVVGGSISSNCQEKNQATFATARAQSLRNLLDDIRLKEIFMKKDCAY